VRVALLSFSSRLTKIADATLLAELIGRRTFRAPRAAGGPATSRINRGEIHEDRISPQTRDGFGAAARGSNAVRTDKNGDAYRGGDANVAPTQREVFAARRCA
jgi:hypothetical protein